jgi:hypothetical protein
MPAVARAAQFTLADIGYTHARGSHYYGGRLAADVPASWRTPTDFSGGKAYVRIEVKKKPNETQSTMYQFCLIQSQDYTCSQYTKFSKAGIYEWSADLARFWQSHAAYDWGKKPNQIHLIVKDPNQVGIDSGSNFIGAPNTGLYLPLDIRITIWIVSKGATLDRTGLPPEPPRPDAGVRTSSAKRDGGAPDAGADDDDGTVVPIGDAGVRLQPEPALATDAGGGGKGGESGSASSGGSGSGGGAGTAAPSGSGGATGGGNRSVPTPPVDEGADTGVKPSASGGCAIGGQGAGGGLASLAIVVALAAALSALSAVRRRRR